jgi:hypothetical protein
MEGMSSDDIEKAVWRWVQLLPIINMGYGSTRILVYLTKGNYREAKISALDAASATIDTATLAVYVSKLIETRPPPQIS